VLAVVLLTMVRPVLTFLDVGEAGEKWTKAIQGLFILLAVVTDTLVSRGSTGRVRQLPVIPPVAGSSSAGSAA
jgi:ribose/xylose/arabinose/galactoside ABC-type transport system permease subunit